MPDGRHPISPSPIRPAIARWMVESKTSAPHFHLSTDVEMDALLAEADRRNEGRARDATLLSDHPVVDGVGAARLLGTFKGLVEAPGAWAGA